MTRGEFAIAMAAALAAPGIAEGAARPLTPQQQAAIEIVIRELVNDRVVPGISYSVGDAARILLQGAAGRRSIEPDLATRTETRCALASVSKQFASAAVYYLRDRGKLLLDVPLSTYLPGYKYAREMTLRQVLTMRAGIAANDETCEAPVAGKIDHWTLIENLNKHKLDFAPGRYFAYTNCGYDVLDAVVSAVSGMPYTRFVEKHFFMPLGMSSSYALGERRDDDFAQGYAPNGKGWKSEPATRADAAFASGNLVSTVGDMQRWDRALLNATLLPRKTLQEIFTIPATGGFHYASGWFVEPSGVIWHGGSLGGYGTVNFLVPQTRHAIVLLSNTAPSERWRPEEAARRIYNAARLGPQLPPFLKRVRSTAPA